jgi:hypothetical protein
MNHPKRKEMMSAEEEARGRELLDKLWDDLHGYSPDEACYALISVLATLVSGAAANPSKTAESLARNLVRSVARPAEKSELN